jgi:hypothetical protein
MQTATIDDTSAIDGDAVDAPRRIWRIGAGASLRVWSPPVAPWQPAISSHR